MAGQGRDNFTPVAEQQPFDNDSNGFVADNTQEAIEELRDLTATSASPGFTWGDGGSTGPGKYLKNDDVESNKSGRLVPFDGFVTEIFVNNDEDNGDKELELRRRRPCQTGPWTTIASVTVVDGEECGTFDVNDFGTVEVLAGDELSMRVANGSDDFKDTVAGIIIKTSTSSSGGGGGGDPLEVQDEGIQVESNTTTLNFTGAGVTASSGGANIVNVDIPGAVGTGEANTASNVGAGEGVFKQKTGIDLEFKSISSTGDGTVTSNTDEILINFPTIDPDVGKVSQGLETAGGQVITAGADITYATIDNSSIATIAGAVGTINKAGSYEIHFDVTFSSGSTSRSESQTLFQEDTGGGFVNIPGTTRKIYHRTTNQGDGSASCTIRRTFAIGDQIKVNAIRTAGGAPITTLANGSVMTIKYLRSSN